MSNISVYFVNLCADPEPLTLGTRDCIKLRCADNTGSKNETRFFDAIMGQERDVEKAQRLAKGDRIAIQGQLVKQSYKAKKDGKGIKKGQTIYTDAMPFATILEVIKSPSFFSNDESSDDSTKEETPEGSKEPSLDEGNGDDPLDI